MDITEGFLRLVLPNEGYYCATVFFLGEEKPRHFWFDNTQDLAVALLHYDRLGHTVYFACASYKTPTRRTQANVLWVRALWFDVDKFDINETPAALARFCMSLRSDIALPKPWIVNSGYGLHCYWLLERAVSASEWVQYARGFGERARLRALGVDPARTTDAASILRPPGSRNHKQPGQPRQVELALPGGPPVQLDLLPRHGNANDHANADHHGLGELPEYLQSVAIPPVEGATGGLNHYEPADANMVADQCAHMAWMRNSKGQMPEPLWNAALGVLHFCQDGERLAHEWSTGDDRYRPEETQKKFDAKAKLSGPPTCEFFYSHDTEHKLCERCPHWGKITTPVQLGRVQAKPAEPEQTTESGFLPALPEGFLWAQGATGSIELHRAGKWDGGKQGASSIITPHPVWLHKAYASAKGSRTLMFRLAEPHMPEVTTFVIDNGDMVGPGAWKTLDSFGCDIHDFGAFQDYVRATRKLMKNEEGQVMEIGEWGWTDKYEFVIGDTLFRKGEALLAPLSPRADIYRKQCYHQKGTKEKWYHAVDTMMQRNLWTQAFALLASFASPLMRFTSTQIGGTIVAFYSPGTGTGKTLGLIAAASVWGNFKGQAIKKLDTPLSRYNKLAWAKNLPVFFDDMTVEDANYDKSRDEVRKFVDQFQQGEERDRLNTKGDNAKFELSSWQTILMSSSNTSLIDKLRGHALGMRILEITTATPVVIPKDQTLNYVQRLFEENYGHAGCDYGMALSMQTPDDLAILIQQQAKKLTEIHAKFMQGPHRFWINCLAACRAAGLLLNHYQILEYDWNRVVMQAADHLLDSDHYEETKKQLEDETQGMQGVAEYLNACADSVIYVDGPANGKFNTIAQVPRGGVHMRFERTPQLLYVERSHFIAWCETKKKHWREMIKQCIKSKALLQKDASISLTAGTDIPSAKVGCFKFDLRVLQGHAQVAPAIVQLHASPAQSAPKPSATGPRHGP